MPFQVLSLSGGGFMGLYTAAVLAGLEEKAGAPLAQKFDLIAGTSIGGILALGLAAGVPAAVIRDTFQARGNEIFTDRAAPQGWTGRLGVLLGSARHSQYAAGPLRSVIADLLGADTHVLDLKQRLLVTTVNLTKGSPQVFKTPHHPSFQRDWRLPVVDVALATSAAPVFFPIHKIGGEMFADGGLYANAPDDIALHEAEHFLGQARKEISVLSIGTTTARFAFSGVTRPDLGWLGWMNGQRLPTVMIGAQQMNTDFMMRHRLGSRYLRIDYEQSPEQAAHLALDVASPAAIETLEGLAEASLRQHAPDPALQTLLSHKAELQRFAPPS